MATANTQRNQPKPGDLTGRQRAAAQKKNAEEQAEAAERMAMISAQKEIQLRDEVVDLSDPNNIEVVKDPEIKDPRAKGTDGLENEIEVEEVGTDVRSATLEETEVDVKEQNVVVRVNDAIEMTYAGVSYEMEPGPKYRLPKHIADHLEERGLIWH